MLQFKMFQSVFNYYNKSVTCNGNCNCNCNWNVLDTIYIKSILLLTYIFRVYIGYRLLKYLKTIRHLVSNFLFLVARWTVPPAGHKL